MLDYFAGELNLLASERFWGAVMTLLLAIVSWVFVKRVTEKVFAMMEKRGRAVKNPDTIRMALKYLLIAAFGVQLLNVFGVNVSSLLAGLGLAGVVVGFAVQDVLKDLTMGANIIADSYFSVGDVISVGNVKNARVLSFNIKTTRLEDLDTGNTITMANRNISEVTVLSNWQDVEIPAPYEEKPSRMRAICWKICERLEECEYVSSCAFLGTQELGDSAVFYKIRIIGVKDKKRAIRRAALEAIQDVYEAEGISVPYPHMDISSLQR